MCLIDDSINRSRLSGKSIRSLSSSIGLCKVQLARKVPGFGPGPVVQVGRIVPLAVQAMAAATAAEPASLTAAVNRLLDDVNGAVEQWKSGDPVICTAVDNDLDSEPTLEI